MASSKIKFKNDQFKKSRGGYSRLLDLSCAKCGNHICFYQKDGPGILKRMYLDRISNGDKFSKTSKLVCSHCQELIGVQYVYEKENRLAYRIFVGAIIKKIIKSS